MFAPSVPARRGAHRRARWRACGPIDNGLAEKVLEEYYVGGARGAAGEGRPRGRAAHPGPGLDLRGDRRSARPARGAKATDDMLGPLLEAPPDSLAGRSRRAPADHGARALAPAAAPRGEAPRRAAGRCAGRDRAAHGDAAPGARRGARRGGHVAPRAAVRARGAGHGRRARPYRAVLPVLNRGRTKRMLDELEPEHPDEVQQLRGSCSPSSR